MFSAFRWGFSLICDAKSDNAGICRRFFTQILGIPHPNKTLVLTISTLSDMNGVLIESIPCRPRFFLNNILDKTPRGGVAPKGKWGREVQSDRPCHAALFGEPWRTHSLSVVLVVSAQG